MKLDNFTNIIEVLKKKYPVRALIVMIILLVIVFLLAKDVGYSIGKMIYYLAN